MSKEAEAEKYFDNGSAKYKKGDLKGAIADFNKAIELDPKNANTYNNRGNAKYELKQYDEAIKDYDKAIELNPDFALAYYNRGAAKYDLKQYGEAIKDYGKAIKLNPKFAKAYYSRGLVKAVLKQHKEAIADYDKSIELDPKDARAYMNRGNAKYELTEYMEAIDDFDKAIGINPKYAKAYYNRGLAKDEVNLYEEAIWDYDEVIKLDPKNIKAYMHRGYAKESGREFANTLYEDSIEDYTSVLKLDPKNAEAYYNLGRVYRELGNEEKALKNFKKAQELDPTLIFQEETKKAKKEVREEIKEEIKEQAEGTRKTQEFQKTLEDLKKKLIISEYLWLGFSILTVVITAIIFILPFFENSLPEFTIPEKFLAGYFLFPFLSIVSFTVLRIYTNTRKHRLETENRLAMAKMLARIENKDKIEPHYQEHFLPELAKIIINPLYPERSKKTDATNLSNIIKNLSQK